MSGVIFSGVGANDAETLRLALGGREEAVECAVEAEVVETLASLQPLMVVLGPEMNGADRFDLTRRIAELDPTIGVLIVGALNEANVVRALEAGARGVLASDSSQTEARQAVNRVLEGARRLREHRADAEPASINRTIVVVSAKGGAGKTMVSVNLASALACADRRRTVLVDLDLQFGDVASALLLNPEHTIVDAADSIAGDDGTTVLKVFLTRHGPTDLFVLCGSDDPAAGERIGPKAIAALTEELGEEFRHVVVDTPAGLEEPTLAALEGATDIVVIVDLDVASVRGGRKLLEMLNLIGMRDARRHIVLNRSDSKVGLKIDEVEVVLGSQIDVMLPSTRAVPLSFNRGEPLVVARPRHPYSRGILTLAERVTSASRGGRK